jgi:hypothetical protein
MPVEFDYDIFLSHSSKDKAVVRPLAERLRADGVKVWFDAWEIKPGDSIPAKIEEGLEHSRVLVLCMSANAFGSDWSRLESGTFRFRDPLNKERRFLPLRLDEAPIKGSLAQFLYINWLPAEREREYVKLVDACQSPAQCDSDFDPEYDPTRTGGGHQDSWNRVDSAPSTDGVNIVVDNRLPGLSINMFVRLQHLPTNRRKYLFDFGTTEGERFSLYISSDNIFTVSFVDAKHEPHVLQIPIGELVYLGRFMFICCQLGIGGQLTMMNMWVDDREIGILNLPFRTDLGILDVPNGTIGADLSGDNGAAFDLSEAFVYSMTASRRHMADTNVYMHNKDRNKYVEFNGTSWMRVADADIGKRDAQQSEPDKRPILRVCKH